MLRMADYWALEPPASYLMRVRWGFGRREEDSVAVLPRVTTPFHQLPKPVKRLTIERWLRLNEGKTEADFFKHIKAKGLEKYAEQLKKARNA